MHGTEVTITSCDIVSLHMSFVVNVVGGCYTQKFQSLSRNKATEGQGPKLSHVKNMQLQHHKKHEAIAS